MIFEMELKEIETPIIGSKISSKGQVTLPKRVRERLGAEPGDLVAYEFKGDTVTITRIKPFDKVFHASVGQTLDEWNTPEDDEAFRGL